MENPPHNSLLRLRATTPGSAIVPPLALTPTRSGTREGAGRAPEVVGEAVGAGVAVGAGSCGLSAADEGGIGCELEGS